LIEKIEFTTDLMENGFKTVVNDRCFWQGGKLHFSY